MSQKMPRFSDVMATIAVISCSLIASAQTYRPNQTLDAQFTTESIAVDGTGSEKAWGEARAVDLTIGMDSKGVHPYEPCSAKAKARAL